MSEQLQLFQNGETEANFVESELDSMEIDFWYKEQLPKILKLKDFRTKVKVETLLSPSGGWNQSIIVPLLKKEKLIDDSNQYVGTEGNFVDKDGKSVPDKFSEETDTGVKRDPVIVPEPVVEVSQARQGYENLIKSTGASGMVSFGTADGFVCTLKPHYTNGKYFERSVWFTDDVPKIGTFSTDKDFFYALRQLVIKYMSMFRMVVNPPYEIFSVDGQKYYRLTKRDKIGFDLRKYIKGFERDVGVTDTQNDLTLKLNRQLESNDPFNADKASKFVVVSRPHEIAFHIKEASDFMKYYFNKVQISNIIRYLEMFHGTGKTYFPNLRSHGFDDRFHQVVREICSFRYYNHFSKRVPSIMKYNFNTVRDIVRSSANISNMDSDTMYEELAEKLKINVMRFGGTNKVPAKIVRHNATDFFFGLITSMVFNAHSRLKYRLADTSSLSVEVLVDLIVLKAIAPMQLFNREDIIRMDNRIYKMLICNMKAYNGKKETIIADYETSRNLLTESFAASWRDKRLKKIFADFLVSNYTTGDGWSTGGTEINVPIPENFKQFFNRKDVLHFRPYGMEIQDERVVYPQLQKLNTFLLALNRTSLFEDAFDINRDFIGICKKVNDRIPALAKYGYLIDRLLRRAAANPMCFPMTHSQWRDKMMEPEPMDIIAPMETEIIPGMVLSYALMLEINDFKQVGLNYAVLRAGLDNASWAKEFTERYYDARDYLRDFPDIIFTLKEKTDLYFNKEDRMFKAPFEDDVIKYFIEKKNFDKVFADLDFVDRRRKEKFDRFRAHIEMNHVHFGWINKYYITYHPESHTMGPFSKVYSRRNQPIYKSYTREKLVYAMDDGTLAKDLVHIYNNPVCLEILDRTPIVTKEFGSKPKFNETLPISFNDGTLRSRPITLWYQVAEHVKYDILYGVIEPSYPVGIPAYADSPFILEKADYPLKLQTKTLCFNRNFHIVDDSKFYSPKFVIPE